MKNVVSISLGTSSQDYQFAARFMGQKFTVRRVGTGGSLARARRLLKEWEGKADAIGLGVQPDLTGDPRQAALTAELAASAGGTVPVTNGARLADIFLEWA